MIANWSLGLAGLACLAMMALVCLPMALGGLRRWWRRRGPAVTPRAGPAVDAHGIASFTDSSTLDSRSVR